MKYLYLLLLIFCLGCHEVSKNPPRFNEGDEVTIKISGKPGVITHVNQFASTYDVRYEDNVGVLQEVNLREYEITERQQEKK